MIQTTVQNSNAIRWGSVKFEVTKDFLSWINMGVGRNAVFEESKSFRRVKCDNGGEIEVGLKDHTCKFNFDAMEIDLSKLVIVRGGIDKYSTIAGTAVTGAIQNVASGKWVFGKFIPIERQNANGSQIVITAVKAGSTALTTEYTLVQDEDGNWGLIVQSSTALTTAAQILSITYNYTPAVARVLKSGGLTDIGYIGARFTNVDSRGKILRVTIYKGASETGLKLNFPGDESDDPAICPIEISGTLDGSRTAGEQLFEIYDEQGV